VTSPGPRHLSVDLDGPVHYVDFGGDGPPLVLVHGLGGSHVNWMSVGPALAAHGRVLALDLVGHGHTHSMGRSAGLSASRRLIARFVDAVAGGRAVLVGNSMGGYLSIALAAARPEQVSGLVLVDPALPLARGQPIDRTVLALFAGMSTPLLGELVMLVRSRRGPERLVTDMLRLCCVDSGLIEPAVLEAHLALARERELERRVNARDFLRSQRSLVLRLLQRRRFFRMLAAVKAPALVVHGECDRLVQVDAARALAAARPDWRLEVIENVGHVPQLEAPGRFLAVVEPWLRERRRG
jgi:pimeloyl-ACP methyl ester carboxylesterase